MILTKKLNDMINKIYQYHKKERKNYEGPIINPGIKSQKSLLSKVKRNLEIEEKSEYALSDISDMARCSILFDAYKEIPEFIKKLKQTIPEIYGDICRTSAGYIGIHLNFVIDGVRTEIQLSTTTAFQVKQATEISFSKWRDFNLNERIQEIEELKTEIEKSMELKVGTNETLKLKSLLQEKQDKLRNDLLQQQKENDMSVEIYKELHSDGELESVVNDIESLLLTYQVLRSENEEIKKEFAMKFVVVDGRVDVVDAKKKIKNARKIAQKIQDELIKKVEEAVELPMENCIVDEKTTEVIGYIGGILKFYDDRLHAKVNEEFISSNIRKFSKQKTKLAVSSARYALENGLINVPIEESLKQFQENVKKTMSLAEGETFNMNSLIDTLKGETKKNERKI